MKKIFFIIALLFSSMLSQPAYADEVIPTITSVSPVSGTTDGGNIVTISGADFTGSTVIKINGVRTSVTFVDSSTITLTMPANSAGFVNISAANGMVAAVLNNIYEYISPPPAAPSPSPTPSPTPTPTPTPSPTPTPTPSLAPAPASEPTIIIEQPQESSIIEEISLEAELSLDESIELIDLSSNSYLLYENGVENLIVENVYEVPNQFILKERVNGKWVTVSKSYQFNNNVVYLNTSLNVGSTYKVVIKIDGVTTIVSWFDVLMTITV
jgi:hypothetical protein